MDKLTRRAFFAKVVEKATRIAASGVAIHGTRDAQESILFRLATVLGGDTWLGRLFGRIWLFW